MLRPHSRSIRPYSLFCAISILLATSAYAGDGVIEINQAKALAGGVTPEDAEGFPVTLSQAGSYRLTGNLTLPNANTHGILIGTDHITVDLNGFAIIGPTVCTSTPGTAGSTCSNTGSGRGITGDPTGFAPENITILNGTVRGVGSHGIQSIFGRVERVRAISNGVTGIGFPIGSVPDGPAPGSAVVNCWAIRNGFRGIEAGERSLVEGNVANFNGVGESGSGIDCSGDCVVKDNVTNWNAGDGITCSGGCTVASNTANSNGHNGINAFNGTARGNTTSFNTLFGLVLSAGGYAENVVSGNAGGTVDGGIEIGINLCDGDTSCP